MEERRAFRRIKINSDTNAVIGHNRIVCSISDLSEKGALLEVKDYTYKIVEEEVIGEKISFIYSSEGGFEIKYVGVVKRCETIDTILTLGIEFDDQFFFQEEGEE